MGFPAPEHDESDEEKKLEVLQYLGNDCWLADTVHKESTDTTTVNEYDHPAFFSENSAWFDYPEASLLNEMISDGLIGVHISPWTDGGRENPHYNLRHFRLTDKGRQYLAGQKPVSSE